MPSTINLKRKFTVNKIKSLLCTLALAICCCAPIIAQALPNGSYLKTCNNCVVRNHHLHCTCLTQNQRSIRTALNHPGQCARVKNINGNLSCMRNKSRSLPAGNYAQSCRNCHYEHRNLVCNCFRRNQSMHHQAFLRDGFDCNRVVNHNGNLRCRG